MLYVRAENVSYPHFYHIRIFREGVIDEVACWDHVNELEKYADQVTKEIKMHISSSMKVSRETNKH